MGHAVSHQAALERLAQWARKKCTQHKNSPDMKLFKHVIEMDRFQYGKFVLQGETILQHDVLQIHFPQLRIPEKVTI